MINITQGQCIKSLLESSVIRLYRIVIR